MAFSAKIIIGLRVSNNLAYHGISGGKKFFRIDSKKFLVILEFIKVLSRNKKSFWKRFKTTTKLWATVS